jgi:FAD/FMN-containing dehydrogenase
VTLIGVYLQPTVQGTSCHCEFSLSYDPKNKEEVNKVKRFVTEGRRALANTGAFFSRPYGPWADIAYSRAVETVVALRKVKNIFDPNGVMNPGKLCF